MPATLSAPHRVVEPADAREQFLVELFDALWVEYRSRVSYVRTYEEVVAKFGGTFFNDHIAFRTFARQSPQLGIVTLARLFQSLGYVSANCYQFPDKHLSSIHFQHANPRLPKLFITELQCWKLSEKANTLIAGITADHPAPLSDETLYRLANVDRESESGRAELLESARRLFSDPLWAPPSAEAVKTLNAESQFAAWVAVHGYRVNHFTALVNSHGVEQMGDIEKTIAALSAAGVPMKTEIEGARGTKLRQTATEAVMVDVPLRTAAGVAPTPWTYAYFEIAERGEIVDPETGRSGRFEGFLGPQATNLFEMTRVR